jgi:hypothetical protein
MGGGSHASRREPDVGLYMRGSVKRIEMGYEDGLIKSTDQIDKIMSGPIFKINQSCGQTSLGRMRQT